MPPGSEMLRGVEAATFRARVNAHGKSARLQTVTRRRRRRRRRKRRRRWTGGGH